MAFAAYGSICLLIFASEYLLKYRCFENLCHYETYTGVSYVNASIATLVALSHLLMKTQDWDSRHRHASEFQHISYLRYKFI